VKAKGVVVGTDDAKIVVNGSGVKLQFTKREHNDNLTVVMYQYAKENLALVNIYIKDPAVTQIKREQKIPLIWFVANVGGILGLTMGCSLVTVFEILLHVGLILYRTWIKSTTTIKRRLTCDSKAAFSTMVMAAAPNDVIAVSDASLADIQQMECVHGGDQSDHPRLQNCSNQSSSVGTQKRPWPPHQGSSSVEIIETKAAANGYVVTHNVSSCSNSTTTVQNHNYGNSTTRHSCGGTSNACGSTSSCKPRTKFKNGNHRNNTSPIKDVLQPTITTNSVSIFEDESANS